MRRSYLVSGMVQGVGFRYFTCREGRRIGVTGWVRNLDDGRVEALAEGTDEELEEFERALGRGPAGASVTNIHVSNILNEIPTLIRFEIQ